MKNGGQGMPKMLTVLADEMLFATNPSFMLYPLLSVGAGMALSSYASQEQKKRIYLRFIQVNGQVPCA